jgi:hypothetical protein
MTLDQIIAEADAIGQAIARRKALARDVYQREAKDHFAAALGLKAEDLYLMPYADWSALRRAHPELIS